MELKSYTIEFQAAAGHVSSANVVGLSEADAEENFKSDPYHEDDTFIRVVGLWGVVPVLECLAMRYKVKYGLTESHKYTGGYR
jgi:hypothetical protein